MDRISAFERQSKSGHNMAKVGPKWVHSKYLMDGNQMLQPLEPL